MVVVLGVPDNNSISPIVITPVGTHTLASASPSTRYGSKLLVGRLELKKNAESHLNDLFF